MVGHIDAGGIVDRVGVDSSALQRILDSGLLREAEIAALDDYFAAQLGRRDPASIVGMVTDFGVGFAG